MALNVTYNVSDSITMSKNMTDLQTDLEELKINVDTMFLIINGIIVSRKCLYIIHDNKPQKTKKFEKLTKKKNYNKHNR